MSPSITRSIPQDKLNVHFFHSVLPTICDSVSSINNCIALRSNLNFGQKNYVRREICHRMRDGAIDGIGRELMDVSIIAFLCQPMLHHSLTCLVH